MNAMERSFFEDILKDFNRLEMYEISLRDFYRKHPKGYLNWIKENYERILRESRSDLPIPRLDNSSPEAHFAIRKYLHMLDHVLNGLALRSTEIK